jgi:hypothetical protein
VRIIIFCTIVALVSFGAYAQEEWHQEKKLIIPQQSAASDATTLNVIGNTPKGKRDLTRSIEFPKNMTRDEAIDACAKELAEFLKHKFPEQVELKARVATCVVPEFMGDDS